MKKTFAILMALVMLVSVIPFAAAVEEHEHYDNNKNDICDAPGCTEPVHTNHYDENGNGVCDHPGCTEKVVAEHTHIDANVNGVCDYPGCSEVMPIDPIGPGADDEDDDPTAGGNSGINHDHTFYGSYKYNKTYHWRQCWCGYIATATKARHTFNRYGECYTCNYEKDGYDYDYDYGYGDYRVYLSETGKGDTRLSTRYADKGDTVYIYVDPDRGYDVEDIEVYASYSSNKYFTTTRYAGRDINVMKRSSSCYYFRMPAADVTVRVEYGKYGYYNDRDYGYDYYGNYSDVDTNDWFYSAVDYVTDREIMSGTSSTKFSPNENMTRATLAQALYAISGANATGRENFSDVDSYDWYYEAVVWCSSKGIIEGWNGKFVPDGDITREDLAVMLYRYANYKRYNTKDTADLDEFSDADDVSSYAVEALEWAVAEGIINGMGNGTLNPQGTTTRAQAAAMIMRFCKSVR